MLIVDSVAVIALSAATIVILGLGSIVFLSTLLLTIALMFRSRWDKIADTPSRNNK